MKREKNWFFVLLTAFCVAFGLICLCVALAEWLKGTASAESTQTGLWAVLACFLVAGFFSFFIFPSPPFDVFAWLQTVRASYETLSREIEVERKTVTLGGITLSPDGFSYRRFFKKVFVSYPEVAQSRSHVSRYYIRGRIAVTRVLILSVYKLFLKTPHGPKALRTRISRFARFQKKARAILFIEKKVSDLIFAKEWQKYKSGQKLDFGDLSLHRDVLSYAKETLDLKNVVSYGVEDRWISLHTKLPGRYNRVHFKRRKVWNEAVLFSILEENFKRFSSGSA
jgi:hypothetical protein